MFVPAQDAILEVKFRCGGYQWRVLRGTRRPSKWVGSYQSAQAARIAGSFLVLFY